MAMKPIAGASPCADATPSLLFNSGKIRHAQRRTQRHTEKKRHTHTHREAGTHFPFPGHFFILNR